MGKDHKMRMVESSFRGQRWMCLSCDREIIVDKSGVQVVVEGDTDVEHVGMAPRFRGGGVETVDLEGDDGDDDQVY